MYAAGMRIGLATAAYEPLGPWWTQQTTLPSGCFIAFGGRGLNKHDYRITAVVVSQLPRYLVCIAGRALRPRQGYADFLSIRLGANTPKLEMLSVERTLHLFIDAKGRMRRVHQRETREELLRRWGEAVRTTTARPDDWEGLEKVAEVLRGA